MCDPYQWIVSSRWRKIGCDLLDTTFACYPIKVHPSKDIFAKQNSANQYKIRKRESTTK